MQGFQDRSDNKIQVSTLRNFVLAGGEHWVRRDGMSSVVVAVSVSEVIASAVAVNVTTDHSRSMKGL